MRLYLCVTSWLLDGSSAISWLPYVWFSISAWVSIEHLIWQQQSCKLNIQLCYMPFGDQPLKTEFTVPTVYLIINYDYMSFDCCEFQIFHTNIILKGYVHVKKNINMFFYNWLQLDLNPEPLSLTNQPRTTSLAKCFLSVCLRTKGFWVRVQLQLFKLQILRLLQTRSSLTFRQL